MSLRACFGWMLISAFTAAAMRKMSTNQRTPADTSDDKRVEEECAGYRFTRAKEAFATGHNGAVKIFLAEDSQGKQFVWKADRRAGPSGECSLLKRLGNAEMMGLGCATNCAEGLLIDAVMDSHTGEPAKNLKNMALTWLKEQVEIQPMVERILPQVMQELEKMMTAGILNLDQNWENVLVQSKDLHVTLIDFGDFEGSVQDFGDWSSIPNSYKVAMFGPVSIGLAFCGFGVPYPLCEAATGAARNLLVHNLDGIHFHKNETKQLATEGLRIFVKKASHDTGAMFDMMRRLPVDAALTKVHYRAGWDSAPSEELTLIRQDGDLVVQDVSGRRAPYAGVQPGWRLVGWRASGVAHTATNDTKIEDLDAAHQLDDVYAIFDFPRE